MLTLVYIAVCLAMVVTIHIAAVGDACRLFRATEASWRRVTTTVLALVGGTALLQAITYFTVPREFVSEAILAELAAMFWVALFLYRWVLKLPWRYAVLTWLLALGVYIGTVAVLGWPLRALVLQTFKIPTNSMAPTLLGTHFNTVCPHCQGNALTTAFGSPSPSGEQIYDREQLKVICRDCLRTAISDVAPTAIPNGGDHIVVDKTVVPKRWDLLVFRPPNEPEVILVQRLIALPGETISLRSGRIFINDELASPPGEIAALRYVNLANLEYLQHDRESYTLAEDEYFVLGDNSPVANDSRSFGPIQKERAVGVVTVIYWPVERWRVFR